jgi:hypothetical protein
MQPEIVLSLGPFVLIASFRLLPTDYHLHNAIEISFFVSNCRRTVLCKSVNVMTHCGDIPYQCDKSYG